MQNVKLDIIQLSVFACLGIPEILKLHVIYVSMKCKWKIILDRILVKIHYIYQIFN